jgi:uncharacterized membrane-anchored protein
MREGYVMSKVIMGQIYEHKQTKKLIHHIPKGAIAFVWHEDLDCVSVNGLIDCGVKAVINGSTSMTGRYDHSNVLTLLEAGVSVFDVVNLNAKDEILNGEEVLIIENTLYIKKEGEFCELAMIAPYDEEVIFQLKGLACASYAQRFDDFLSNTIQYAKKEQMKFIHNPTLPNEFVQLNEKEVVIVARGGNYEKDLAYLKKSFVKQKLIILAVDGAADGLLKMGMKPDFIIGDMDSVSEESLMCGAVLICHQYQDGHSPASKRVESLGLPYQLVSLIGTSEDMAIQAAFWSRAKHIYLVGCRFGMKDFLEKGRAGMASSVLTRIQAGDCLTDLKGIHKLKQNRTFVSHRWLKETEQSLNEIIGKVLIEGKGWLRKKGALRHE